MVSDCGLSSPGLSPGWGHCVVFLGTRHYSRSASPPRCTTGYWKTQHLEVGSGCDGLASHSGGSMNIPSHFMLLKTE